MDFKVAMLLSVIAISGCGKKVELGSDNKKLSSIQAQMDNKQFERAIPALEAMRIANPQHTEVGIKLLHAYAGAATFETVEVIIIWKEIEAALKEIKEAQKNKLDKSIKVSVDGIIADLEKVVAPIPQLSDLQQKRLNQAISLYQELGLEAETAGKYNNFKWGSLHLYRLGVTIKEIVTESKRIESASPKVDLKAIEQMMLPKLKLLLQDIFMAYKLYGNSFDKVKKITESLDNIIAKTVGDEEFKLRINSMAKNEGEFFNSLIKDNSKAASVLIRKMGDIYHANGYIERIAALGRALPTEEEIKTSQKKVEALITVLITNLTKENPEIELKLKAIFTEDLKRDLIKAVQESIKTKNTTPLKALLSSKKPEIEVLNSYYLFLKGELETSELEENIKLELEALRSKVELELLKSELKTIEQSLKADAKTIEMGLEAMARKTVDKMLARQQILEKEIKWLEKYLGDLAEGMKQSSESNAKDDAEMEKITQDVLKYVES